MVSLRRRLTGMDWVRIDAFMLVKGTTGVSRNCLLGDSKVSALFLLSPNISLMLLAEGLRVLGYLILVCCQIILRRESWIMAEGLDIVGLELLVS